MTDTRSKYGPLIGSIDEGTSSTRFLVFASKTAEVLTYHQVDVPHIVPREGWFEQDPMLILHSVIETIDVSCENLKKLNINYEDIVAVGITNQRETTVLWDPTTGKPLYNALVWMDMRTSSTVDTILQNGKRSQNFLQNLCGLPVSTYFSALKIKWMMDNVKGVKEAMAENRCIFGNIDTWLIWNLTGGVNGGLHITDVTNASRTMLMRIDTLKWDKNLCKVFDIPMHILPEIRSSAEIYGYITNVTKLAGVPVSGILGDQQAALVGQMCFNIGQAKSTYGTGCFILYNTGTSMVRSTHGLLTTVGYQLGPDKKPTYALEGSVAIAGISVKWLRDNLQILKNVSESTELAQSVDEPGEVYFVPAFSGLYAPYWRKDARSVICGLTEETKPGHIAKAALEGVCYQVRDVLEAMALDCGFPLSKLLVDGGMTSNDYLMQLQADYCGIPVVRPTMLETTALGAAIAAGTAKGVEVWNAEKIEPVPSDTFCPSISDDVRDIKYSRWKMAIRRSFGWAVETENNVDVGHAETKSHTRHPHSGSAHHRSIRADTRSNLSYETANAAGEEFTQMYSKQNAKLVLECAVNINFSTSIWLKDGQIVQTILKDNTNNKRVIGHRFLVDAIGNLAIDNVRLEDDGRWQCEAEDAFGFVVQGKPIQLTVLDSPKKAYLMIDNRILDPGNPFIPVKENADLTVSCVVDEGNPKPSLSWELTLGSLALLDAPEVPLEVLNLTETVRDQKVGARNDARLGRVLRAHHNATLTCFVRHIALEMPLNASVLLNVQYTPSFAISREPGFGFPIREGMPVSLKCDVDANPKALPIWQKDDTSPPVQQTPDGFLNFTEIRREHSGWYKCIARHRLGRFSSIGYFLNVRYDMEVTQEPDFDIGELSSTGRQLEVSLGGAVQLACPPGTTGCWTRVEPGTGRLEPMGASQELRLDNVLYQEAGEYRCVAPTRDATRRLDSLRNALSVQVVVKGRPTVAPTNKSITAVYGQPLTLTMEFCANPPYNKVLWIAKNKKVYKPGDADKTVIAYGITNSTEPNCHQAVLFLTKVTNVDIGEYSFIVRSPNGLTEGNFHVNLTYASGYSVQPEDGDSTTDGTSHVSASFYINVIVLILNYCYY